MFRVYYTCPHQYYFDTQRHYFDSSYILPIFLSSFHYAIISRFSLGFFGFCFVGHLGGGQGGRGAQLASFQGTLLSPMVSLRPSAVRCVHCI